MSDYLPSRDGLLRANLRDTIRRLKKIQKKAGKEEPEEETINSGDPFTDISTRFVILVTKTKLTINERNAGARLHGVDRVTIEQSAVIRRGISDMGTMVAQLKNLLEDAEHEAASAKKKNKKDAEVLEKAFIEKRGQYEDAVTTVDVVKEMDQQMLAANTESTDIVFGRKANLRQQLSDLKLDRPKTGTTAAGGQPSAESGGGGGRLEEEEGLKEHFATIRQQDEKIDAGLDRLRQGMSRLKDLSSNIGDQLNVQNQMLEDTEHKMDRQSQTLYNLNNRIAKLMKESSPINTFIYCCCVVLIISMLGFVLVQFGVI